MLQQPTAATPAEPLESLSFPDMREVEAVLSPQDVNKGLAQADPLTRHPRVSSIVLCVVFGLLMLAASAGVWWLGVRTMDGQSYEDIVWSKFDAALPGWLAPVVHVFAISAVVITVSVIMGQSRLRADRAQTVAVDRAARCIRRPVFRRGRTVEAAAATPVSY